MDVNILSFLIGLDIWREYIPHILERNCMEEIRQVIEKALTAGGFHFTKGELLWNVYRYMEMASFETIRDKDPAADVAQAKIVSKLFQRQPFVPLSNMTTTWSDYEKWLQESDQVPQPDVKKH